MNKYWQKTTILVLVLTLMSCSKAPSDTVKVLTGSIQNDFTEVAMTHLHTTAIINLPIAGKLNKLKIDVGDTVGQGEVIAQLQQLPLKLAVRKAQQSYMAALKYYDSARQAVKAAYAMKKFAAISYFRNKKLIFKDGVSQQQLDQFKATYDAKTAEWHEQQQQVNAYAAAVAAMRAELNSARYDFNNSTIRSPVNGVILSRHTEGGLWLAAGTPLMQIGNPQSLEAISSILSVNATNLKVGDKVKMGLDGYKYPYSGQVKQIYPQAFTKRSALGVEEQRVNVLIGFKLPNNVHLGVNYRLYAKFITAHLSHVLIVPRTSVLQDTAGHYYVYLLNNKKLVKTNITVGVINDRQIQVLSGLKGGDSIQKLPTLQES